MENCGWEEDCSSEDGDGDKDGEVHTGKGKEREADFGVDRIWGGFVTDLIGTLEIMMTFSV